MSTRRRLPLYIRSEGCFI